MIDKSYLDFTTLKEYIDKYIKEQENIISGLKEMSGSQIPYEISYAEGKLMAFRIIKKRFGYIKL